MKRPEGFDPRTKPATAPVAPPAGGESAAGPRVRRSRKNDDTTAAPKSTPVAKAAPAPASSPPPAVPRSGSATVSGTGSVKRPASLVPAGPETAPAEPRPTSPGSRPREPRLPRATGSLTSERESRRELKRAARRRRRFEKGEVKRFTRRARTRRVAWLSAAGVVVVLVAVLLVAVYSPLLALRTVTVDGTSRVDAATVVDAVDGQVGTPLALVDYDAITRQLAKFPLIRSYVTEVVPPDTLVVHVVERAPVATVVNGAKFDLLDPAGIVVQSSDARPEGFPLVDIGGQDVDSTSFASVVEVLLSLPAPLLAQVDTISASTKDNVTFILRGVGQSVVWGSSDDSAVKARTLSAMVANQDPSSLLEYDVSAPGSVVVTPR